MTGFVFSCCITIYHKLWQLKTTPPFIISQFYRLEVWVGSLGALLGVPQAEIKVLASLCSYLEDLQKPLLTDALKLAEFSSL